MVLKTLPNVSLQLTKNIYMMLCLLLLGACGTVEDGSIKYLSSNTDVEGSSISSPEVSMGAEEIVFFPADFERSVRMAASRSSEFQSASMMYRASIQDIVRVQSSLKPQISAGVGLGAQSRGSLQDADSAAIYNVAARKTLLDGGRVAAQEDIAKSKSSAAKAEVSRVLNNEAKNAAIAWITLWYARERRSTLQERTKFVVESQLKLRKLFAAGILDKVDEQSIDTLLEDFSLNEKIVLRKLKHAEVGFDVYFDTIPGLFVSPTFKNMNFEDEKLKQLVLASPAVQRLEADLNSARGAYDLAKADMKPSLNSSLGVSPVTTRAEYGEANFSIGFNLNYELSDGGRRQASFLAAQENLKSKQLALEAASTRAHARARSDLIALELLVLKSQRAYQLLSDNEVKIKSVRSQLVTGKTNIRSLIQQEIEGFKLFDGLLDANEKLIIARLNLAASLGLLSDYFDIDTDLVE